MQQVRKPTLLESSSLILVLLGLVVFSVQQGISILPAMMIANVWAVIVAKLCGYSFSQTMEKVFDRVKDVIGVFFIILLIGVFVASMIFSGTVPIIIYYTIKIINPSLIVVLSFLSCAIIGVMIGTSWGTIGTIGVILLAIGKAAGVPTALIVGAIASGSHIGQLISPMADTTNIAAGFANSSVTNFARRTMYFVLPAAAFSLIMYLILGMNVKAGTANLSQINQVISEIKANFFVSPLTLLPMLLAFYMTFRQKPVVQTLTVTSLVGVLYGVIFNHFDLAKGLDAMVNGFDLKQTIGLSTKHLSSVFVDLCNRGGANSMVSPAILIILASMFGTIIIETGAIGVIANALLKNLNNRVLLTFATQVLAGLIIILTSSTFLSAMMAKDLLSDKSEQIGLDALDLLSAEASVSTQILTCVPWCDTALFIAGISGVSTLASLPYNFFAWSTCLFSLIFAILGIGFNDGKRLWRVN